VKRVMIFIIAAVIGLGVTGCDRGTNPSEVNREAKKTITIGVMPDVESIPLIIADRNGYFEDEGVTVEIEHFKSARDRDSALQAGRLDGVITDIVAVVFSNEGGIDLKIVSKNDGDIELMAGKGSDIEMMADIKGKSLGLSYNTIMEYTADRMLESAGISDDDVKKVDIPALSNRLEMLQGGKIDAAILPHPLAGLGVKNGARVLASTSEVIGKAGAIAFTSESLRRNREEIKAVFRAYNRAVEYLKTAPASSYIDYVVEVQSFPAGLQESIQLPAYDKASLPDPQVVADVVKWMKEKNLIQRDYQYSDLVDQEILREIQ